MSFSLKPPVCCSCVTSDVRIWSKDHAERRRSPHEWPTESKEMKSSPQLESVLKNRFTPVPRPTAVLPYRYLCAWKIPQACRWTTSYHKHLLFVALKFTTVFCFVYTQSFSLSTIPDLIGESFFSSCIGISIANRSLPWTHLSQQFHCISYTQLLYNIRQ